MVDVNLKVPAIEKLLDYAASGIGAVAGPMLATWKARQDAKAKLIGAQAEADSLRLIADAQADARRSLVAFGEAGHGVLEIGPKGIEQRIEFQEKKRQANIVSVVRDAAADLGDKEVPDREPDPDWTARFFEGVQDVSSEDLRKIWSKILAGEVDRPGQTSLHTLSILRNMSRRDAETFSHLMKYSIHGLVHHKSYTNLSGSLHESKIIAMQERGLLHGILSVYKEISIQNTGATTVLNCNHVLLIEGKPNKKIQLEGFAVTIAGQELARFSKNKPDVEYLKMFAKFLANQQCTLKLAPVIGADSHGKRSYYPNALLLIEPAP